jgi:hypothetical protein
LPFDDAGPGEFGQYDAADRFDLRVGRRPRAQSERFGVALGRAGERDELAPFQSLAVRGCPDSSAGLCETEQAMAIGQRLRLQR